MDTASITIGDICVPVTQSAASPNVKILLAAPTTTACLSLRSLHYIGLFEVLSPLKLVHASKLQLVRHHQSEVSI